MPGWGLVDMILACCLDQSRPNGRKWAGLYDLVGGERVTESDYNPMLVGSQPVSGHSGKDT